MKEHINIAVNLLTVEDVEGGISKMPYYNTAAWRDAQKKYPDLRRTFSQLSSGTRPGKKETFLKTLRKYL